MHFLNKVTRYLHHCTWVGAEHALDARNLGLGDTSNVEINTLQERHKNGTRTALSFPKMFSFFNSDCLYFIHTQSPTF